MWRVPARFTFFGIRQGSVPIGTSQIIRGQFTPLVSTPCRVTAVILSELTWELESGHRRVTIFVSQVKSEVHAK